MSSTIETGPGQLDLVVIGAGIHGSVLAYEAARAGYRVGLVEQGDFGEATSANSLKIIHGGIRYLQHGDFKRMRESIVSRRAMMRFAPHLVKPLACLMPTYGHGIKGREMMRLAFGIYDLVASDRNQGLAEESRLPAGSWVSRDECRWIVPGIKEEGLSGGAVWYDAIAQSTERLVLEYVREAERYGAYVRNYTRATEIICRAGRVVGVRLENRTEGGSTLLSCRAVVNSAGPWYEGLTGKGEQQWASAMNLVVKKRLFHKYAVGLEGYTSFTDQDALIKRGKRLFFFVPWRQHYTMIGTTYAPYRGRPEEYRPTVDQVEEMVAEVNKIYPQAALTLEDVTFCHGGLVPMSGLAGAETDAVQLDKSSLVIDHGRSGGWQNFYSIKGVKYTTAPDIAGRVLRLLQQKEVLGSRPSGSYRYESAEKVDHSALLSALGEQSAAIKVHLQGRYGNNWREVFGQLVRDEAAGRLEPLWLDPQQSLLAAEVRYFIAREQAMNLSDVVLRRSDLGSAECPTADVLAKVAACMAEELGWDGPEQGSQVAQVMKIYLPLGRKQG